jgi:pimeloyl-ACP methyl ester carboxylesterase
MPIMQIVTAMAAVTLAAAVTVPSVSEAAPVKSVVLVHGAFVDGTGWRKVFDILKKDGYAVSVVQNSTATLAGDVAATKRAISDASGPVVLVGHSYGGAVITEAGNDPKVAALVYVAAFAPDSGESVGTLTANPPPGIAGPPLLPPEDGALLLDRQKFAAAFAADVDPHEAAFMAASQTPWGLDAINGKVSHAAWHDKPSWYLLTTKDKMIPPVAQHQMAERAKMKVTEVATSHAVFLVQPKTVAAMIEKAAQGAAG